MMDSKTSPEPSSTPIERWNTTWNDFLRALKSKDPFNPFVWVYRLALAGLEFLVRLSRLDAVVHRFQLQKRWTPLTPLFSIGLIVVMVLLYFKSIRTMIQERWCSERSNLNCVAIWFHDFMVIYFATMVLYYYFKTNLTSPGVALPSRNDLEEWSCMDNRGGFYGSWGCPKLNVAAERALTARYDAVDLLLKEDDIVPEDSIGGNDITRRKEEKAKNRGKKEDSPKQSSHTFPNIEPSFCDKCNIKRPPRCHHCTVCRRCILQFDHHCVWVNNCIGYNNYRSFLLLIFHIVLACWYSLAVLVVPFYEMLREEQKRQESESPDLFTAEAKQLGSLEKVYAFYHQSKFFDDIPRNPLLLVQMAVNGGGLPPTVGVKLAYPILLGVGVSMTIFLGLHIKYIAKARTTLEHKITLEMMCDRLWEHSFAKAQMSKDDGESIKNPFDQGWRRNFRQMLGPNILDAFVPVHVDPPLPFLPEAVFEDPSKKKK